MTCCDRLSKSYLILVNFLIASFGCALVAFGMMASQQKFEGAILFPINILKMINILGVILLFTAVIGIIGAFYRERKTIHIIYLVVVIVAFVFQIITAIVVYQLTANTKMWLSKTWAEASKEYREYAQDKFSCCGFANPLDHPVANDVCSTTSNKTSYPPCFEPLVHFISHELAIVYIILFSAISIEILGVCNSITLLCTRMIYSVDAISLQGMKKSSVTLVDSAIEPSSDSCFKKSYYSHSKSKGFTA